MRRATTTVLIAAALVAVTVPARAKTPPPPRPDLVVASGTLTSANAALTGSFVVANAGKAKAGKTTARLTVAPGGHVLQLASYAVGSVAKGKSTTVKVALPTVTGLAPGSLPVQACADAGAQVKEKVETNNCRTVGTLVIPIPLTTVVPPSPAPPTTVTAVSSKPSAPIAATADQRAFHATGGKYRGTGFDAGYWYDVPPSYSATTPISLLVWLHGCGGIAQYDVTHVSDEDDSSSDSGVYSAPFGAVVIAPQGPDGGTDSDCWATGTTDTDVAAVMGYVHDAETHWNIDLRRVVIAGYSSGGDLAYRTIFGNATTFAGILAINTSPFRDTGSTQQQSLAAATWKFNVVHVAHADDDVYPLSGVQSEISAVQSAGFPVDLVVRPGHHYDNDTSSSGSYYDVRHYLLPHLQDGWVAPATS